MKKDTICYLFLVSAWASFTLMHGFFQKSWPTLEKSAPMVTVFIHGTSITNPDSLIAQIIPPLVPCTQGMYYAPTLNTSHYLTVLGTAQALTAAYGEDTYCFCWSGALSHEKRIIAAHELHKELDSLITHYRETHKFTPTFRIITHSHGGNVALNLVEVQKDLPNKIIIDELILLACPVQKTTKDHITNQAFKKIYSLYAPHDVLQIADPNYSCERTFPEAKNLIQHKVSEKNFILFPHVAFIAPSFIRTLPDYIQTLAATQSQGVTHE